MTWHIATLLLALPLIAAGQLLDDGLPGWSEKRSYTPSLDHSSRLAASIIKAKRLNEPSKENQGLPSFCSTYEERYGGYHDARIGNWQFDKGNKQHAHSRYVVILQMHRTENWDKEDLVLSVRALAAEVQEVGFNFYILYQIPRKELSENPDTEEVNLTREEMLGLLPPDMHGLVMFHDVLEDSQMLYPNIEKHASTDTLWGPGHRAPHAPISNFMKTYKKYEFAFVIEYDIRLIGSHWGKFLASALQQAVLASGSELDRTSGVAMDFGGSATLPRSLAGLPDLLAFHEIWKSDKWVASQVGFNETMLEEMRAMIYGGSRRFFDKMHELSQKGRSMFVESLLPAIPRLCIPGGKTVVIRIPMFGESFHCCSQDGTGTYAAFFKAQSLACMHQLLVHPVKNKESFWPMSGIMAASALSNKEGIE